MTTEQKYSCQGCDRTDLTLTRNGKVRSHAADGKRASETNPACGMGSEWPKESTEFHTHRFEYGDDDNGHSGSFCDCGLEEPAGPPPAQPLPGERDGEFAAYVKESGDVSPAPPNPFRDPLPGGVWDSLPHDRQLGDAGVDQRNTPESLGTCTRCGKPRDGHAHDVRTPVPGSADSFLDGVEDEPEADPDDEGDGRRYFESRYDGTCITCMSHFEQGDMITRGPDDDGWEGQDCCGEFAVKRPERPRAVARTLPVERGRYVFPHPVTGKKTSGQRASKYAEGIQDKYTLDQWKGRMIVLGMTIRPDLIEKAQSALRNEDPAKVAKIKRDYLNKIADDAKLAAGSKTRAEKGTKLHKYTEELDGGTRELADVPDDFQRDAEAYVAALAEAGFVPIRPLIERSVYCDELGVTGTFDRVLMCIRDTDVIDLDGRPVQIRNGEFVIGDVKSGDNIESPWLEILVQEAIYAHAVNENGVAVQDEPGGPWRWEDLISMGAGKVREDVGIVMHIPYGSHECKLYYADLITGWRGARLCKENRDFWKIKLPKQPVFSMVIAEDVTDHAPGPDDQDEITSTLAEQDETMAALITSAKDLGLLSPGTGSYGPEDDRITCACGVKWDNIETANAYDHDYQGCGETARPKNIMEAVKQARDKAKDDVRLGFTRPTAATVAMPPSADHAPHVPPVTDYESTKGRITMDQNGATVRRPGPTNEEWTKRFTSARTREEANTAWREAKAAGVDAMDLRVMVSLVQLPKQDQEQAPVSRPTTPPAVPPVQDAPKPPETPGGGQAQPNLTERAHRVTTKDEASKIFHEAKVKIGLMETDEQKAKAREYLNGLVKIMQDRLKAA